MLLRRGQSLAIGPNQIRRVASVHPGVARMGVILIFTQIVLACATPPTPVPAPTSAAAAAPTNTPAPTAAAPVVPPTATSVVASPSSGAIASPATPAGAAYPSPQTPATPQPGSPYPSPQTPATPQPGSPYPSPVATTERAPSPTSTAVAIATPTHPAAPTATATPAAAVALTVNQVAATAIAAAAGEECVASPPKPAKGFIGDPVRGRMLFVDRGCSACHGDQAQGLVGPKLAGTTLTFSAVIQQLRQPRGVMQRYLPKDQSDADECDVYQYLRNLKS